MMRGKKKDASVTLPFCLAVSAFALLILTLAEAARYDGLKADAREWTHLVTESLFAGYQPILLEEYHLFFLDGGFAEGTCDIGRVQAELEVLLEENLLPGDKAEGINLYRMQPEDTEILRFCLATDEEGRVFQTQAANVMKQELGWQAAKEIKERIEKTKAKSGAKDSAKEAITDAEDVLKAIAKEKAAAQTKEQEEAAPLPEQAETAIQENPLDILKELRKQGILSLVLPKGKTVSAKTMPVDHCLLKRDCAKGNYRQEKNPGWYERILMQEFIKPLIGNAVAPKEEGALAYGAEYLICGKGSDEENLKGTVKKLLLLREGLNYLYLQQDSAKQSEALSAAAVIAGALASPEFVAVIKEGILAAWAYAESICDVKALLSGGKIPLIKTAASWQAQLSNLLTSVTAEYTGEKNGMTYENYLDALLYTKTVKQAAYRSMDLMEQYLRSKKGYEACRMDAMLVGIKTRAKYSADPLFLGMFGTDRTVGYRFWEEALYIYGQ